MKNSLMAHYDKSENNQYKEVEYDAMQATTPVYRIKLHPIAKRHCAIGKRSGASA